MSGCQLTGLLVFFFGLFELEGRWINPGCWFVGNGGDDEWELKMVFVGVGMVVMCLVTRIGNGEV